MKVKSLSIELEAGEPPVLDDPTPEGGGMIVRPFQILLDMELTKVREKLLENNRRYGNSALDPVRIFSQADPEEGIRVRLDDKLSRLRSGQLDDPEDATIDLIGYLLLLRIHRRAQAEGVSVLPESQVTYGGTYQPEEEVVE